MAGAERDTTETVNPEDLARPEWTAVMHLLTTPLLGRVRGWEHVDSVRGTFDAVRLLELAETGSSGERTMLRAACDLFNGSGELMLSELIWGLDEQNLRYVLEAIELRRGLYSFSGLPAWMWVGIGKVTSVREVGRG